jgi:hypothetical protein
MKWRRIKWKCIACGVGFCPLWWQWGVLSSEWTCQRTLACGPFRVMWRGWR